MVQPIMSAAKERLKENLHEQGFTHLNVRTHGAHLVIYSEEDEDKINRARLTRINAQTYELSMSSHRGKWETTPFTGSMAEILTLLTEQFPFTLTEW